MAIHINPNGETSVLPVKFTHNLVRTGVIGDGNCMFHAILSSYSNKYIKLPHDEKIDYVTRMRKMLPDVITKDVWLKIGCGETSRMEYSIKLFELLKKVYDVVLNDSEITTDGCDKDTYHSLFDFIDKNKLVCKFICTKMRFDEIEKDILDIYKQDKDVYFDAINFVKLVKKFFKHKYAKNLSESDELRFNIILNKVIDLFDIITKTAIELAYMHCKNNLGDSNVWIGTEYLSIISDLFSVNIYFIDAKTMLPYVFGDDQMFTYHKSIVLLWIDDSHFEIVGMIEDNTVRRTFNSEEDVIKMIHMYSVNPIKASELYQVFKTSS